MSRHCSLARSLLTSVPQYTELGFDVRRGGFDAPIQPPSGFAKLVTESAADRKEANFWLTRRQPES